MLVLVGLGNPGEKYARHRHNIGFMAADAIADAHGFGSVRSKFQGEIREGFLEGPGGRVRTLILKPMTYMNESGRAVREVAQFYKLSPENFVVFYDELDLAPGKVKMKTGGGHAGHNGIRSIDAHLGNAFRRVRIGIGHPGDKAKVVGHVLGNFSRADQDWLAPLLDALAEAAPRLAESDARFLSDVALRLGAQKPKPASERRELRGGADASSAKPAARRGAGDQGGQEPRRGPFADALNKLLRQKD